MKCPTMFKMIAALISCIIGMDTLCAGEDLQPSSWQQEHTVLSHVPASEWHEALPIGNGRLGAMVYGSYPKEQIQLNEDTVCTKPPIVRHKPGTEEAYERMWQLCLKGDYRAAHEIMEKEVIVKARKGSYQTLGDLWITHVAPSSQTISTGSEKGSFRE